MKLIKEEEDRILYKTIEFDNKAERKEITKQMKKDDWEDLDPDCKLLIVTFRKYIEQKENK